MVECRIKNADIDISKKDFSDWGIRPLNDTQLEYAKMDCVYLAQVYQKLLELDSKINKNKDQNNLDNLCHRYKKIEEKWLLLDSEIQYLKELIKEMMIDNDIKENDYFKITSTKRTTIKTHLQELVKLV